MLVCCGLISGSWKLAQEGGVSAISQVPSTLSRTCMVYHQLSSRLSALVDPYASVAALE